MVTIIAGRGEGKTQALIDLSEKEHIPIIVPNFIQANHIVKEAYRQNKKIPEPIVAGNSLKGIRTPVLIDNIEQCEGITSQEGYLELRGYSANDDAILYLCRQRDKRQEKIEELEQKNKELQEQNQHLYKILNWYLEEDERQDEKFTKAHEHLKEDIELLIDNVPEPSMRKIGGTRC